MANEPWYETVNADQSVTQGDLIFNCPILSWKSENLDIQGSNENEVLKGATDAIAADVVVMTQACDLEHEKVTNVILCPHLSISEYCSFWKEDMERKGQNPTSKVWKNHCNDIRDGFLWNLSMLNEFDSNGAVEMEIRLVDFHEVFTVPRAFLESLLIQRGENRYRLLPPYREHLSQSFARFFMRVGLPIPIDKEWSLFNDN
jgi:hypothetical protein